MKIVKDVTCQTIQPIENITELEWMFGEDYLIRVVFKEGDRQWGQWMTTSAKDLAPHIWETT